MTLILPQCTCLNLFQNSAKRSNWRRIHSNLWLTLARTAYTLHLTGKKKNQTLLQPPPPLVHSCAVTKIKPYLAISILGQLLPVPPSLATTHHPILPIPPSDGRSLTFDASSIIPLLHLPKDIVAVWQKKKFYFKSWYGRVLYSCVAHCRWLWGPKFD